MFVQTVVFGSTTAAIALAYDLKGGMIDRFRSLPMARSAVLAGRTAADAVRNLFVIILMVLVGYAVDFRFQGGVLGARGRDGHRAPVRLCVLVVLRARRHARARSRDGAGGGLRAALPARLRELHLRLADDDAVVAAAFAEHQPITQVADAVRGLSLGTATTSDVVTALVWIVGMLVVFAPLATWRYRKG